MITATFTQFRNNAASYFDKVERGESVEIYRHGKPSAVLVRTAPRTAVKAYWKSVHPLLDLGGDVASGMLRQERTRGR